MSFIAVAQVGVEPTASFVLSQGGLPVAYRAMCPERESNPQTLGFKPSRSAELAYLGQSGPGWNRTIVSWVWAVLVAVGPRDRVFQVESPGVAPGSPACDAGVVLLDHDPCSPSGSRGTRTHKRHVCRRLLSKQVPHQFGWLPLSLFAKAEAVRLELTSGSSTATCFQGRLLIRPDGFRCSSCGGWNRTNMKTFKASHPAVR